MEQLGIDLRQIAAQLINFVLFFLIFKKFIATPFLHFLNEGRKKEKEAEDILAKLKSDEENLSQKQAKMKEEMKKEMERVLKEAKKEAEAIKNELITDAKKEAEGIKDRAKKQLEEEREKLNQAAKERMIDLSVAIVDKAFKDYLDEDTKKRITRYILTNLAKGEVNYEN
ncbi:ATP synthase F0 subunit B [Candidatus Roizmanbacteria bacterium RIFCSPHIGHO2_02_FULL_38_11]|uniref:ATP synthase subunit b n=1 Tax=Candidatus Roizmanbacteria bacterium RIFCSPHIGHO2_02_FULL_38_11 TaxID=1802039 RepID=A0A1F7GXR1_9BACT|nr:MAG: ATP synthase F0 subunit B [Candidatus Roizmanbacteria bacterium RIFCSPHIGHO2_02_FULL_38_11]